MARLTWQLFFDTVLDVSCLLDCCWVWEFSLIIGCGIQVVWHGCKAWQFQKSKDGQSLPSAKMFPNQPHGFAIIGEGAVCHHYTKSTRKAAQTAVESVWEISLIIGCGIQVVWHGCKAWQFQKSKDERSLPSAKMFPNQPHGFAIIGEGAVCHHYTKSTRKAAQRPAIFCSKMQPSSFT